MTPNVRPFGFLPRGSFLRAAFGGVVAGAILIALVGCSSKPVCTRDSDCGVGYICVDNERCVLDPLSDAGMRRPDAGRDDADAGVDAGPAVQPSSCNSKTDDFDPEQVYFLGSLPGIDCSPNAISALNDPGGESVGFPCGLDARTAVIRPNGNLVYLDTETQQVFEFTRDVPPFVTELDTCVYPFDPADNDTKIATTACDNSGKVVAFLLGPDDPGAWYTCANTSGQWFDEAHQLIGFLGGSEPLARGVEGWVLARSSIATGGLLELYDENGSQRELGDAFPEGEVVAVRALADGLHVVVENDGENSRTRVIIGLDGGVTPAGTYPSVPDGITLDDKLDMALDGTGALHLTAVDAQQSRVVVKLEPDGAASVVYTEPDQPEVSMDGAALVTGL